MRSYLLPVLAFFAAVALGSMGPAAPPPSAHAATAEEASAKKAKKAKKKAKRKAKKDRKPGKLHKGALAIVDPKDSMTTVRGLVATLERLKIPHTDLSRSVARTGKLPLGGVRVLALGSFATSHPKTRATLEARSGAIREFLRGGGVVVVLAQADEVSRKTPFLPPGLVAHRGDLDFDTPHLLAPKHPLFAGLTAEDLSAWEVDAGRFRFGSGYRGAYDSFSEVRGLAVLAAREESGSYPVVLEGSVGKGTVLLVQLAPDEVSVKPARTKDREPALRMMRNLLGYVTLLADRAAGKLPSTGAVLGTMIDSSEDLALDTHPPATEWRATPRNVSVLVFEDRDGDGVRDEGEPGMPGMQVTVGWEIRHSGSGGTLSFDLGPEETARIVSVSVPATHEASTSFFARVLGPDEVSFGLKPRAAPPPTHFTFAQVTDVHIGAHSALADEAELRARVMELNSLHPRPAFLLSTGDATAAAKTSEFGRYRGALAGLSMPVLTSCGNHDRLKGHEKWDGFEREIGPVVFSFDYGGYHFATAYESYPGSKVFDWLAEDLRNTGDRPTILFMHHYPRRDFLDALVGRGVVAVLTGDWHGNKVETYRGIISINTGTVLVGGLDHSPPAIRLIHASPEGIESELRYVRALERITVASPPTLLTTETVLPIVVNAYDTVKPPVRVTYRIRSATGKAVKLPAMVTTVHVGPGTLAPVGDPEPAAGLEGTLDATSALSWRAPMPLLPKGSYVLEATAHAADGSAWSTTRKLKVKPGAAPRPRPTKAGWPMFRKDPERTGIAAKEVRSPLRLAWVLSTPSAVGLASPVTAGGKVFLPLEDRASVSRGISGVIAADARTGKELWRFHTPTTVAHSVAVSAGFVVLQEVDGTVHALNAATGKERWSYDLASERKPIWASHWVSGAPIIDGEIVWAGYHPAPVALELETGRRLWKGTALGREAFTTYSSLALGTVGDKTGDSEETEFGEVGKDEEEAKPPEDAHRLLMVPSLHDGLRAFSFKEPPRRGKGAEMPKELWSSRTRHRVASTPILSEGVIFYTRGRSLVALEAETGELRWKATLPGGWHVSTPVVADSRVYFATARGTVTALDALTGAVVWETSSGPSLLDVIPYRRGFASITSSPAVSGDFLYIGGNDGYLRVLRRSDGRVMWKYYVGAPIGSSPAVTGNTVYIAAMDGNLYCFVGR